MESSDLSWRKATRSAAQGGCVEIGTTAAGTVAGIRDSRAPERGHLAVTPDTFRAFLARINIGELDA